MGNSCGNENSVNVSSPTAYSQSIVIN